MRRQRSKSFGFFNKILVFFLIILVILVGIDLQLRPIIKEISCFEGKELASKTINQAVLDVLSVEDASYNKLVYLVYNSYGNITSAETDTIAVNKLQSEISIRVNKQLKEMKKSTISISLGSLTGLSFLNGQGPILKFKILPTGYAKTELTSQFISVGINQTLHKISLRVTVDAIAIIPGNNTTFTSVVDIVVADTVIVGNIPESYTNITGDNRGIIPKINDYKSK